MHSGQGLPLVSSLASLAICQSPGGLTGAVLRTSLEFLELFGQQAACVLPCATPQANLQDRLLQTDRRRHPSLRWSLTTAACWHVR